MSVASLAFVSAPSDTPTKVLDLTAPAETSIMVDGFTLGAPTFEAAPRSVGAEYGDREASFTVQVVGTYSAAATAMQAVSRQLLAERNWLMVRWASGNKPVFLRTYRTQQEALTWESSGVGIWELPVKLVCDPFLYGAPVTVGPVTVTNNPASGTNPAWYKFATVLGDAPTGLKVTVVPSTAWDDYTPLLATVAFDPSEAPAGPTFWQAEAFANRDADTTIVGSASTYSGSSYLSTSFATSAAMVARVYGVAPSTLTPGTYKVLCRIGRSDTTTIFAARFGQQSGPTGYTYGDTVTMSRNTSTTGYAAWLDLGEFTLPIGAGGVDLADIGSLAAPNIALQVQRISGTGQARIDAFMLVPVDTATTIDTAVNKTSFVGAGLAASISGVWDGTRQPPQFRAYTAGALAATLTPPRVDGRFLRLVPGATNVFYLLQQTKADSPPAASGNTDVIAQTASVTFDYYPKYLHARPDAT